MTVLYCIQEKDVFDDLLDPLGNPLTNATTTTNFVLVPGGDCNRWSGIPKFRHAVRWAADGLFGP